MSESKQFHEALAELGKLSADTHREMIVEIETLAAQVATLREGNAELMRQRDAAERFAGAMLEEAEIAVEKACWNGSSRMRDLIAAARGQS